MNFDLSTMRDIESELDDRELFYLNYKTSDADSMKKYLFGDICRYQEKKPKEENFKEAEINFDLGNPASGAKAFRVNSFERGRQDAAELECSTIDLFRQRLEVQLDGLLSLFSENPSIYINFRFGPDRLHWYELTTEIERINERLLRQFVVPLDGAGFVLSKSLYKTLGSGKESAPGFTTESLYKSWLFPSLDSVSDLLFAIDISQRAMIRKGDIKIVVLPRANSGDGERLSALHIEDFFSKTSLRTIKQGEEALSDTRIATTDDDEEDDTDTDIAEPYKRAENLDTITQFDFVFSRASSSPSTPDVDVIELSGVSKSRLGDLYRQVTSIRTLLEQDRERRFQLKGAKLKRRPSPLNLLSSLNNVLGEVGREKKKYSSHLLSVLPKIYCGTYISDDALLPAFINTVERKIRDGTLGYDFLRYDLLFLYHVQEENRGEQLDPDRRKTIMPTNLTETYSYRIGQGLGRLARPVSSKINSFQKNYIGLLSRRIAQLDDVIAFHNYMDQKLFLHYRGVTKALRATSYELTKLLNEFPRTETYNREYCAYGFFESYFEPSTEPLVQDDDDASDVTDEMENEHA